MFFFSSHFLIFSPFFSLLSSDFFCYYIFFSLETSILVYSDFLYSANASDETKKDYRLDWIELDLIVSFLFSLFVLKSHVGPLWVPCPPLLPSRTTTRLLTYLPTYLSTYLLAYRSICLSTSLPVYQSTRLPTCLHNYKPTYPTHLRT